MSQFLSLPRETKNVLRRINIIGERIQEGIKRNVNPYKLHKLEEELKLLCDMVGIELDDVLDIYLSHNVAIQV